MESATPLVPAVQTAKAIEGLRLALAASGVTGTYVHDEAGAAMLGCPRTQGWNSPAAGDLVIWCDGKWFWWQTGRVRRGRRILTLHSAADPAGAARRISELRALAGGDGRNATPAPGPATPPAVRMAGNGPNGTAPPPGWPRCCGG
jgi:hypothetical protein